MKANEAPEKIYCGSNGHGNLSYSNLPFPNAVEYTRNDIFLDWIKNKAEKYIVDTPLCSYFDYKRVVEDFKEYMKGE